MIAAALAVDVFRQRGRLMSTLAIWVAEGAASIVALSRIAAWHKGGALLATPGACDRCQFNVSDAYAPA